LVIATTQLPKLFGVKGGEGDFFERVAQLLQQLPETNLLTLVIGVGAILALLLGEKFLPGRPVALGVVLVAIGVASVGQVDQHGVKVVGQLPVGLPHFQVAGESLGQCVSRNSGNLRLWHSLASCWRTSRASLLRELLH
jgi:MFS superfamily sulfate permease-like transporter